MDADIQGEKSHGVKSQDFDDTKRLFSFLSSITLLIRNICVHPRKSAANKTEAKS